MSLLTTAASLALAGPAVALDRVITFQSYSYSPTPTTIKTGDTATFSGNFMTHPLVWDSGTPETTNMGTSKSFSFSQAGTYTYQCAIHGGAPFNMVGALTVIADQHPASVSFSVNPVAPQVGEAVTFAYTGTADPDGTLTSWQWDLDGNGSFETVTPTGTVTSTYANPGAVTVRMRAIDDSNEASATAEQAVTIAAAGAGSGSSGGGASGSRDTTAPHATLVRLSGLKLSFRSSERASATATLRARGKTLARGSAKAGATTIRLRLTAAGRARLHHGQKLRVTLTLTLRDKSGNARKLTRQLTVRRP
jgi:plastocyanin